MGSAMVAGAAPVRAAPRESRGGQAPPSHVHDFQRTFRGWAWAWRGVGLREAGRGAAPARGNSTGTADPLDADSGGDSVDGASALPGRRSGGGLALRGLCSGSHKGLAKK